jgi:hypothetical protein
MVDNSPLREVREPLERLIVGNATSIEEELLRHTLQSNQCSIAIGQRAVALGGDANDAIIITGDGNIVPVFKGLDNEIVQT